VLSKPPMISIRLARLRSGRTLYTSTDRSP
jgi:hypothetical protein